MLGSGFVNLNLGKRPETRDPHRAVRPLREAKRRLDVYPRKTWRAFSGPPTGTGWAPRVLPATTGLREEESLGLWWRGVQPDAPDDPVHRVRRNLVRRSIGFEIDHLEANEGRTLGARTSLRQVGPHEVLAMRAVPPAIHSPRPSFVTRARRTGCAARSAACCQSCPPRGRRTAAQALR